MALIWQVGTEKDLPTAPKNWPQCGDYKVENKDHDQDNDIDHNIDQ